MPCGLPVEPGRATGPGIPGPEITRGSRFSSRVTGTPSPADRTIVCSSRHRPARRPITISARIRGRSELPNVVVAQSLDQSVVARRAVLRSSPRKFVAARRRHCRVDRAVPVGRLGRTIGVSGGPREECVRSIVRSVDDTLSGTRRQAQIHKMLWSGTGPPLHLALCARTVESARRSVDDRARAVDRRWTVRMAARAWRCRRVAQGRAAGVPGDQDDGTRENGCSVLDVTVMATAAQRCVFWHRQVGDGEHAALRALSPPATGGSTRGRSGLPFRQIPAGCIQTPGFGDSVPRYPRAASGTTRAVRLRSFGRLEPPSAARFVPHGGASCGDRPGPAAGHGPDPSGTLTTPDPGCFRRVIGKKTRRAWATWH